jgi:hypothetical protein
LQVVAVEVMIVLVVAVLVVCVAQLQTQAAAGHWKRLSLFHLAQITQSLLAGVAQKVAQTGLERHLVQIQFLALSQAQAVAAAVLAKAQAN